MLQNRKILLGVTGSIAAYKACDLVQRLKEQGAQVRVVMTPSAARIVNPDTFAALTGHPVLTDAWAGVSQGAMPHIDAARWADLFLIAPCTAHILAELSWGLTGSPVSMTALAYDGPLAVAPAMNTVMLDAPAVREHLQRLAARGVHVLPTQGGNLACGEIGDGKLTTPEELAAYANLILTFASTQTGGAGVDGTVPNTGSGRSSTGLSDFPGLPNLPDLKDRTVLISGGHTEEPLDGVRFLANRSSGRTAVTLARAFRLCGANVQLVWGRAEEPAPHGVAVTPVRTSGEFRAALRARAAQADIVVMAAAIADFLPAAAGAGSHDEATKWKASRDLKALELTPAPNILAELGEAKRPGQVLVGFALETKDAVEHARAKLTARRCDLVVVNTPLSRPGTGFGAGSVEAAVLGTADTQGATDAALRLQSKEELAATVVRRAAMLLRRDAADHGRGDGASRA